MLTRSNRLSKDMKLIEKFHPKTCMFTSKSQDHLEIISCLLVRRKFDNLGLSYLTVL